MRYLKSYKLFESIEAEIEETKADIRDILQEAEDMGLYVNVSWELGVSNIMVDNHKLDDRFMNVYVCSSQNIQIEQFKFDDISPLIKHLISYMNSIGYEWCSFNTELQGTRSGYTSSIDLPNYSKPITVFSIQFKKFIE